MNAFSSQDLELLERGVERFIAEDYDAGRRRELIAAGGFGRGEWRAYADLGWLGIGIPEKHGGLGGGLTDLLTILHGAGRGLLLEPLTSTLVVGAGLIGRLASDRQRSEWLPRIAAGDLVLGFANTPNGAGEPDASLQCAWDSRRACFSVSGTKRCVLHAKNVDRLLVTARDAVDGSLRLLMLAPDAPGVTWATYRMIDDQVAGDFDCRDVAVAEADFLGAQPVAPALARILAAAAVASAAESAGAMAALNEMTLEYAKVRKQFGRTLGSFQVLQHRLVDMSIAAKKAQALVKMAAIAFEDEDQDFPRLAAACKVVAAKAGRFVGEQAIQIHGGIGMTEEYMAGHYLKRLLALGATYGDADHHLRELATSRVRRE